MFPYVLKGAAMSLYSETIQSDDQPTTYQCWKALYQVHFPEGRNSAAQRLILSKCSQKPHEKVSTFAQIVRELVKQAYPTWNTSQRNEMAKDYFLNGLLPEIRRWTIHARPTSFEEAVRIAMEEEQNDSLQISQQTDTISQLSKRISELETRVKNNPKPTNLPHQNTSIICNYCYKPGHFAIQCRKRLSDQSVHRQGPMLRNGYSDNFYPRNPMANRNPIQQSGNSNTSAHTREQHGFEQRPRHRTNAVLVQEEETSQRVREDGDPTTGFYCEKDPYFNETEIEPVNATSLNFSENFGRPTTQATNTSSNFGFYILHWLCLKIQLVKHTGRAIFPSCIMEKLITWPGKYRKIAQ